MSELSRNRAEAVRDIISSVKRQVDDAKHYATTTLKDPELITKLTSLSEQTAGIVTHINGKLGTKTG